MNIRPNDNKWVIIYCFHHYLTLEVASVDFEMMLPNSKVLVSVRIRFVLPSYCFIVFICLCLLIATYIYMVLLEGSRKIWLYNTVISVCYFCLEIFQNIASADDFCWLRLMYILWNMYLHCFFKYFYWVYFNIFK